MVSQKQLLANQQNALKSTGPKTTEGKALAKCNSRKHGLLAKEAVISEGEGTEDQQEFDAVLTNLVNQFEPVGSLEEMMVEKIAVSYWRLRRANRYEVGVLRRRLDTATDDYYEEKNTYSKSKLHKTDAEIDEKIKRLQLEEKAGQGDLSKLKKLYEKGKDLSEIYDREKAWKWFNEEVLGTERKVLGGFEGYGPPLVVQLGPDREYISPEDVRQGLYEKEYTDEMIWKAHIALCEKNSEVSKEIERLKKEKVNNKLSLQRLKKTGSLPDKFEMDNLLRYETAIERQLYKAINQLERLQRMRAGDHVPPPVQVDINTLGPRDLKLV